jgi:putative membrane protein
LAQLRRMNRAIWVSVFLVVLIWSGIGPKDYPTWFLEVFPALLGGAMLWYTRDIFPLTRLVYILVLFHCIILMVGGHYTYAEVPLFDWLKEQLDLTRNNYDKVGHFVQGFVPAMVAREIVVRHRVFNFAGWRDFFIVCFCLALSALYEMVEWIVALASEEAADAFLGTQGYVWDTQSDMAYALIGAIIALAFLGRIHDRQLEKNGFIKPRDD